MTNDPITRLTAAIVLVLAYAAAVAVVVHGYWTDANYNIPALIAGILGSGITVAGTLLGVHVGATGALQAATNTGAVVKSIQNGTEKTA